ncbi:hypothetical protein EG68_01090 [Paragonimus skrjabini miyazakii]|uniref:Uncharacterized protein n=1 Tax=Paragonimus skrjabini miyazakii TaxID=59628 RepID=A0A8S9ZBZ7_9TREM|nr:hypothetical protein EG68_01090 [Paragonimus skrjabini miyazakii]
MDQCKNYSPKFTLDDWVETIATNVKTTSRMEPDYWETWKKFCLLKTGHVADMCVQTAPCLWTEEQLEVLRRSRTEMSKHIRNLERVCEDQKQRITELQEKCMAQNMLTEKLTHIVNRNKDHCKSCEEFQKKLDEKEKQLKDLTQRYLEEKGRAHLMGKNHLRLQQRLNATSECLQETTKQLSAFKAYQVELQARLNASSQTNEKQRHAYKILWTLFQRLSRYMSSFRTDTSQMAELNVHLQTDCDCELNTA